MELNWTIVSVLPGNYPLSATMEMRWIRYSDALLCPAIVGNPENGGGGHTLYLEIVSFNYSDRERDFFKEVFDYWVSLPGTKRPLPHWGKMWAFNEPKAVPYLQEQLGGRMEQFKKVRAGLGVDPDNMFTNAILRELFTIK